jgi:hypothetical protein
VVAPLTGLITHVFRSQCARARLSQPAPMRRFVLLWRCSCVAVNRSCLLTKKKIKLQEILKREGTYGYAPRGERLPHGYVSAVVPSWLVCTCQSLLRCTLHSGCEVQRRQCGLCFHQTWNVSVPWLGARTIPCHSKTGESEMLARFPFASSMAASPLTISFRGYTLVLGCGASTCPFCSTCKHHRL